MPSSVIIAVIYFAGVTSNDGLYTCTPDGASRIVAGAAAAADDDDDALVVVAELLMGAVTSVTSLPLRSSMMISRPVAVNRSMVDVGTHAYTGTPCSRATIDYIMALWVTQI